MEPDAAAAMIDALNRLEAIRAADPELARAARGYVGGVRDRTEWEGRSVPFWSTVFEAYVAGYRAGLASPSEELLDEIIWSEIPADGQAHDTSESHCLICGSHYPRHLSDCRYLALRTTKEGDDG